MSNSTVVATVSRDGHTILDVRINLDATINPRRLACMMVLSATGESPEGNIDWLEEHYTQAIANRQTVTFNLGDELITFCYEVLE